MLEYMTAAEERRMRAREGAAKHKKEARELFNKTAKELEEIWEEEKTYILTESQLEEIKQEAKREGKADAIEEYKKELLDLIHKIPRRCIGGANVKEIAEQLKDRNND